MENLKVKYCKYLPFKGYMAMFLFNYLIIRSEYKDKPIAKHVWNHENIHHAQLKDFLNIWIYFILSIICFGMNIEIAFNIIWI